MKGIRLFVLTLLIACLFCALAVFAGAEGEGSFCPEGEHSFTEYVPSGDATCEDGGTMRAKCDKCNQIDVKKNENGALGHKWLDATCIMPRVCENCLMISGTANGHSYDNDCDTVCNECGNEREPTDHKDENKDGKCDSCNAELEDGEGDMTFGIIIGVISLVLSALILIVVLIIVIRKKGSVNKSEGV
ncbi:MAG: hypothetical protein J6B29_01535 [Clostridia bacterium]|nr:hypothetical protein [Clostridia bacterium]